MRSREIHASPLFGVVEKTLKPFAFFLLLYLYMIKCGYLQGLLHPAEIGGGEIVDSR